MKNLLFVICTIILLAVNSEAQTIYQNSVPNGNTWYKIKTRGRFLCKVTTSGSYAEHQEIAYLVSGYYNTAEVTIISEFNYNHKYVDIQWGYIGDAHDRYLAFKSVQITEGINVKGISIYDISDESRLIEIEEMTGSVTEIRAHNTLFVDERHSKVGIGTEEPDAKLSVNGTVHTKEVKVDNNGWSDFVFDDDYELKSIEEVEQYIKENGHLSEIPDQETVEKDGVNLGEMNARLLQKIEELTLYLIEEHKTNKTLYKEVEQLKREVSELKNK